MNWHGKKRQNSHSLKLAENNEWGKAGTESGGTVWEETEEA